ncbi:MAG: T9SS type A sorting domain-containing protein [Flavobacterium sp.]|nr:T9SS type A sorting domain-containing protein [Flavobacterium sp.]
MKKLYFLFFTLFGILGFSQTFYSENMGTPGGTTAITSYTGWQNSSPIVYSGSGDVRTSTASSGYSGASGGGNVFLNAPGENFQIDGLDTSSYLSADLELSFGLVTSPITNQVVLEYSTDGSTWNPITYTANTSTAWTLVTIGGGQIPSSSSLSLRFTNNTSASEQIRIDDVKLSNVSSSCALSLGATVVNCNASTLALDSYSVTIPFTGGSTATYVITTSGTVSGDNPSSVAAGDIIVTFTEGTSYAVNITGGTCNLDVTGSSPECKPVNSLPFYEPFDYTVSNSLGLEQKWTNVNSGDDIIVAAGSLSYSPLSNAGNSVTFVGSGIDCFSPFTTTNSGTVYAAFMVSVTDLSAVTDGNSTYFAILTGTASNSFKARVFFKRNGAGYQLGLDTTATTTNYDSTVRNVGDVVYVIVGYDFSTFALNAWINPNTSTFSTTDTPTLTLDLTATPISELGGFLLRQDNNNTPTIVFDELNISTTTAFLGTKSFNAIDGLKVYPNPVSGNTLYLESKANATKQVQVYDVLGKQVINTTVNNNSLNVANLNAGVYIVKITEEGKTATRKLVVK